MRTFLIAVMACAACAPDTSPTAPMPWLRGFTASAASDTLGTGVPERMGQWQDCADPCPDYGGIELHADVATAPGTEAVLASYSRGIVVLDEAGHVLARSRGYTPTGSADELLALALGDAMLDTPVIAVSSRIGGHRENSVWLELYRVGSEHHLDRLFSEVVETVVDATDNVGSVTFVPGGLVYMAPGALTPQLWVFDHQTGKYTRVDPHGREPAPAPNRREASAQRLQPAT